MKVVKRNGQKVNFNYDKVIKAIEKANAEIADNKQINGDQIKLLADKVQEWFSSKRKNSTVEEISDKIECLLMEVGAYEVAKEYITYRYLHKIRRNRYEELMTSIEEKLKCQNVENQNANVDERSFGGRSGEASRLLTKQFALDYCMSSMARDNHLNNEIYIHDLDSYAIGCHNCLTIPFDMLLANGFNTRQIDIRPAQSINTAMQLVAVIFQLQSLMQFGGVSASHIDWTMVPYVRKSFYKHYRDGFRWIEEKDMPKELDQELSIEDEKYKNNIKVYKYAMAMTEKESHQAIEAMYHNLNSLQSRSGN